MTVRKPEAERSLHELITDIQSDMTEDWIKGSLPKDWQELDTSHPIERPKTKVTLRLDSEMLKWFRKLGPGYQRRINDVLMIYWIAVLSGKVVRHKEEVAEADFFLPAMRVAWRLKEG